uniref:Uncharacterized protein n=1 Tax=Xiphophorus couchianus TaxID=32473 RepID=A0A3B5L4L3_9TELE
RCQSSGMCDDISLEHDQGVNADRERTSGGEENRCQPRHLWLRGLTDGLRESLISPCRDKSDSKTVLLRRGTVCLKTCFKGLPASGHWLAGLIGMSRIVTLISRPKNCTEKLADNQISPTFSRSENQKSVPFPTSSRQCF